MYISQVCDALIKYKNDVVDYELMQKYISCMC